MGRILTCDRYFDGQQFVDTPSTVVVENGRIAAVRPTEEQDPIPSQDEEAQHTHGATLLPGLMDGHVHLVGFPDGPPRPPFELVENGLRLLICNGVTAVRDAGNALEATAYARRWSAAHDGPRVFSTSPVLDVPPLLWSFSRIVETPEAARREVESLHAEGVSWISLYHNLSSENARAAVEAARERDLAVTADTKDVAAETLIEAGVTSIEHAQNLLDGERRNGTTPTIAGRMRRWSRLDMRSKRVDRLLALLRERDVSVCPTLLYTERRCSVEDIIHEPHLEYMTAVMPFAKNLLRMRSPMGMMMGKRSLRDNLGIPVLSQDEREEVEAGLDHLRELVYRMKEAGVHLVAGSDTPSPSLVPGFSLHQELELLVQSDLTPAEALRCATSDTAQMLDREGELGCVREGARADLLLIDGDPRQDITDTRKIQAVYKDGQKVDRDELFKPIQDCLDAI